jgi:plastocyanin
MVFKKGHKIALTVICGTYNRKGGMEIYRERCKPCGLSRIHTGMGKEGSWIELPVIPADRTPSHRIFVSENEFLPHTRSGRIGDRFEWTNTEDDHHCVTEQSSPPLWESQLLRGTRSHYTETWWTKVNWAGSFHYCDEVFGFCGKIAIPVNVLKESETETDLPVIEMGITLPPEGFGFDIQVKEADKDSWEIIYEGIENTRIALEHLSPGSYVVRCRLRNLEIPLPAAEIDWSPAVSIDVE